MLCERCTIVCVFASKELISLCIGNIVISLEVSPKHRTNVPIVEIFHCISVNDWLDRPISNEGSIDPGDLGHFHK